MKNTVYIALAALALAACAKEVESPVAPAPKASRTVTITAGFDETTKTAYDAQGKFSWVQGDKIGIVVTDGTTTKQVTFTADSDGSPAFFTGEVEEGFELTQWASYPFTQEYDGYACNDLAWDEEIGGWRLWGSIKPALEDPLSCIPLIGKKIGNTPSYSFKTAVGVVKFTVENVPTDAAYAYLEVPQGDANLNGWYDLSPEGYLLMENAIEPWANRYNWNAPTEANTTLDYYFFLPVGTIPAGSWFELCKADWSAIDSFQIKQDIQVVRNAVVNVAPIHFEPYVPEGWNSLGMGLFMDDDAFYANGYYGRTADDYIPVEIQQNTKDATQFRLVNPYQAYIDLTGGEMVENPVGPSEYLTFQLRSDIGSNFVLNDSYRTGLAYYDWGESAFDHPYWSGVANYWNNRVIKKGSNGLPANIQLAPVYFRASDWAQFNNASENPKIEIVFPGYQPLLPNNNYPTQASAAYSDGAVNVTINSETISAVRVKVAASLDAGVAAMEMSQYDLTFTASGSQELELAPGTYRLVYKVETNGRGYTYKDGGNFEVSSLAKVALTADMITVSTDATYGGGNSYDGGTYTALVDGNLETYWHSAYQTQEGDDYDWNDLDPTYGAYIDIALNAPLKTFQFRYTTRHNNSGNVPRAMVFAVSSNGSDWSIVDTVEDESMNVGSGVTVTLPVLTANASFTYLRIGITKAGDDQDLTVPAGGSTSIAEIALYGNN